ncbi:hypothetical protein [Halorussus salinisoli]|uniref:hypothetical protein n=1 Tax=Halorussus salinisoli TaxID=2558242 RepID=UPI001484CCF3|nr:hypothetical protein [Halorussus salinisoli]
MVEELAIADAKESTAPHSTVTANLMPPQPPRSLRSLVPRALARAGSNGPVGLRQFI